MVRGLAKVRIQVWASQVALAIKNLPADAESMRLRFVPGSGRSPGGAHGNPLQYSSLENPMARRSWWATFYGVTKNQNNRNSLACKVPESDLVF